MKIKPRYKIRQNRYVNAFVSGIHLPKSLRLGTMYYCYDRDTDLFVFEHKTWPQVLAWLNR